MAMTEDQAAAIMSAANRVSDWAVTENMLREIEANAGQAGDGVGVDPSMLLLFLTCYSGRRPPGIDDAGEVLERAKQVTGQQRLQLETAMEAMRHLLGRAEIPVVLNGYQVHAAVRTGQPGDGTAVVICRKHVSEFRNSAREIAQSYVVWTVSRTDSGWMAENGRHDLRYATALIELARRAGDH